MSRARVMLIVGACCRRGLGLLVAGWMLLLAPVAGLAAPTELRLAREAMSVDAWSAVRVLPDPAQQLGLADARAALARFQPPAGPHANLGSRDGATWVHVPLRPDADAPTTWLLRLNYPLLREVDVTLIDDTGRVLRQARLGAAVPFADREQKTRALTLQLDLRPGARHDLLLRVATPSAALLPLAFMQPSALGVEESHEQALQGLLSGLWLFMLVYSLANWVHRRQVIFLAYAGALASSWLFSMAIFGVGAQYLWPHGAWAASNLSALAPLLMVAANAHFLVAALDMPAHAPRTARVLRGISLGAAALALLFVLDVASYRQAASAAMGLGLLHLALALPAAAARLRRGDRAAGYLLAGCAINIVGVASISALLRGHLPVSFLSLHMVQFTYAAEMVMWLLVLSARLEQLRVEAAEATREHQALHTLAHTDALTGLRNRRGLEAALESAQRAPHGGMPQALALFMLDLDGFKPINDRWGHDTGDRLLRQVATRIQRAVRPTDVVARMGGDEFVVAVLGLRDADAADRIGRNLLSQFHAPFDLGEGRQGRVGATVGYVFTAAPGQDMASLLRRADSAMYQGKQSGKNMLVAAA